MVPNNRQYDRGQDDRGPSSGIVWMILSAALFGYFGFSGRILWPNVVGGDPNWISIVLMWTVRITAIGFAAAAVLVLVHRLIGNLIYSSVGLLSAAMFGVVLVWHFTTDAHAPISPILLLIFAALNGYGSFVELRWLLNARSVSGPSPDR